MMDTSMMFGGSGISVEIYSDDMEQLQNAAKAILEGMNIY